MSGITAPKESKLLQRLTEFETELGRQADQIDGINSDLEGMSSGSFVEMKTFRLLPQVQAALELERSQTGKPEQIMAVGGIGLLALVTAMEGKGVRSFLRDRNGVESGPLAGHQLSAERGSRLSYWFNAYALGVQRQAENVGQSGIILVSLTARSKIALTMGREALQGQPQLEASAPYSASDTDAVNRGIALFGLVACVQRAGIEAVLQDPDGAEGIVPILSPVTTADPIHLL